MFTHILFPTDGSERSQKAAKAAIALAARLGAKLTVYYALEASQPIYDARFHKNMEMHRQLDQRALQEGQELTARIDRSARAAGVRSKCLVEKAAVPYEGIISAAKRYKCDAIFMASRGRGSVSSLLLGSVTQKVLAYSKIPVVVYR